MTDADEVFEDVDVGLPLEQSTSSNGENAMDVKEDPNELILNVGATHEVPTGVAQTKRNPGKSKKLWALLLVGLAMIALVVGLAVGLTQYKNEQPEDAGVAAATDPSAEDASDEKALPNLPRPVILDLDYGEFMSFSKKQSNITLTWCSIYHNIHRCFSR
jgi:hypothetical protein